MAGDPQCPSWAWRFRASCNHPRTLFVVSESKCPGPMAPLRKAVRRPSWSQLLLSSFRSSSSPRSVRSTGLSVVEAALSFLALIHRYSSTACFTNNSTSPNFRSTLHNNTSTPVTYRLRRREQNSLLSSLFYCGIDYSHHACKSICFSPPSTRVSLPNASTLQTHASAIDFHHVGSTAPPTAPHPDPASALLVRLLRS